MTWGVGPWGISPWGGVAFATASPPTIVAVSPGIIDVRGGTVVEINGTNFFPEFIPQILFGPGPAYQLIAEGYLFDPQFDIQRIFV